MAIVKSTKETETIIDEHGAISSTTKETTSQIDVSAEPDFIKIYTKMWCEFNEIPNSYRELFFQLALRMSYCDKADLKHSQKVITYGSVKDEIKTALGWKDAMYYKGLKALCDCGAIKKLSRSEYQINPNYASKGHWKYNPRLGNGGVEDLVATFKFKNKDVETNIVWADDGTNSALNQLYRDGLQVKDSDATVLTHIQISADNELPF